jgi:hypothetical protein
VQSELPALGISPDPDTGGQTFTTNLTKTGTLWSDTVEQLSGGARPGFASAVDYWDSFGFAPLTQVPFLFGVYPGLTGGTVGFANGSVADAMMVAHGQGDLFVDRAIREVTHCGYTTSELSSAFSALVSWIDTGKRAAGDNILNPKTVASPTFGCRFTDPAPGDHPEFRATVSCPPSTRR